MFQVCYVVGFDLESDSKVLKVRYEQRVVSAQVLFPYLGSNYKHIWQPKIGTKVLVYLNDDTFDDGIVFGFLEKTGDDPLLKFSDEGDVELFQHENGTKIEFTNKENERKMVVSTPKEEQINIDLDNQSLEIKDKDGKIRLFFNFKESKIELKADELSIEATKSIILKTDSLKAEISNALEVKSGSMDINSNRDINISATSSTNIKGQSINLN